MHVRSLFVATDGTVFAGTDDGLVRSPDDGDSWSLVGPVGVNDMEELSPGVLVAVGREGGHRSPDGGLTWTQVLSKPYRSDCGDFMQYTYIVPIPDGGVLTGKIDEDVAGPCKIFSAMYRTTDGMVWSSVPYLFWDSQAVLPLSPDTLIYGDEWGGISLFSDLLNELPKADIWVADFDEAVTSLVMDPDGYVYAATGPTIEGTGAGTGVYRSADRGETWQQINTGLADTTVTDLVVYSGGALLAATLHGGVNRLARGSDTWTPINDGLPTLKATALALTADGYVYVGTDEGVYRSVQAMAVAAEEDSVLPDAYVLDQNYPNPFRTSTTIRYELPRPVAVQLLVYDILGREVRSLVNGVQGAGTHEATMDGKGLPSGIYHLRLTAGGFSTARQMLLVR
jgi:hypothetical protein